MTCNVTGILYAPDGTVCANQVVTFTRKGTVEAVIDGGATKAIIPKTITAMTDGTGAIDVGLFAGPYDGYTSRDNGRDGWTFLVGVPQDASALIGDIISQAADYSGITNEVTAAASAAADSAELSAAWAEGMEPGGAGTKSAKGHALDAKTYSDALGGATELQALASDAQDAEAGAVAAQGAAETARDLSETYAGVVSRATSVAGLTDPTTLTSGDKGYVSASGDEAVDGLYEVQSSAWVRIGSAGISALSSRIDALDADHVPMSSGADADLIDRAVWSTGYIRFSDGGVTVDSNWQYTQKFDVEADIPISYAFLAHISVAHIACYSSSGAYLGGINGNSGAATDKTGTYTTPAGTAYIQLTRANPASGLPGASTYQTSAKVNVDLVGERLAVPASQAATNNVTCRKIRRYNGLTSSSKIILYGDSRFSTDYTFAKDAFEQLTGAQCYNGGFSGQTVAQTALDDRLSRIWVYAPTGPIIFLPGGNDIGSAGTVGTFDGSVAGENVVAETDITANYTGSTFIQAVDHTVRKIQDYYYDIRTRAALTGSETEAEKTAKIDALVKPYIILCTDLPQQRSSSSAWALSENLERKRAAIAEVGRKNNVHTVDTMADAGWDMALEPSWTSPTDKTTNNGIYTMDGLHPNKWGHRRLAEIICGDTGLI